MLSPRRCCFARRLLTPSAVRAADNVSVGTVGSASANLWPVFIGIKKGFFDAART